VEVCALCSISILKRLFSLNSNGATVYISQLAVWFVLDRDSSLRLRLTPPRHDVYRSLPRLLQRHHLHRYSSWYHHHHPRSANIRNDSWRWRQPQGSRCLHPRFVWLHTAQQPSPSRSICEERWIPGLPT
jgi:hypothetical protein